MNEPKTIRVVIDRREGSVLVALDDDAKVYEFPSAALPSSCRREGVVLDVPLSPSGEPQWKDAMRNSEEEARRQAEASERLERLRRTDPGGDVQL